HGPHLPTKTDALIADVIVNLIAQNLKNVLQAQTIRVGCSDHHLSFAGTISLKKSTLKAIIHDYIESLQKHGFQNIIFLPTHGGNFEPIKEAVKEVQENYPKIKIIAFTDLMRFMEVQDKIAAGLNITVQEAGGHAGEVETSEVLFLAEDLVKKVRFQPGYVGIIGKKEIEMLFEKGMPSLTDIGVLGDPTKASKEHGKIYIEKMVEFLTAEIKKKN
ncbi:MAG: creatininase family protein, partial [Promethearchaeota archaeon]